MSEDGFENNSEEKARSEVLLSAEKHLENHEYLDAIRDFHHLIFLGGAFEGRFGLFKSYSSIFFSQDDFPYFMDAGDLALLIGHDALEYGSHPLLYEDLSTIYFLAGETQSAVDMIEEGLEKYPDNFHIMRNAAEYLGCFGGASNTKKAITLLDKAIKQVEENKEEFNRKAPAEESNNDSEGVLFDMAAYLIENLNDEKRRLEDKMRNMLPELEF
ncbi:MAG: hypothetical protein AB1546_12460 [bacterium]